MPQFAANLSLMYTEVPFLDRFAAAARDGFKAVEFLFPYAYDPSRIAALLKAHGLQLVLFNAPPGGHDLAAMAAAWDQQARGTAALPGREAEFRAGVLTALRYAQALDCPRIHVLSGIVPAGVERESLKGVAVDNLRWAAATVAPADPCAAAIGERLAAVRQARARGEATIPSTVELEQATNLFVRASSAEQLANLRASKDHWAG